MRNPALLLAALCCAACGGGTSPQSTPDSPQPVAESPASPNTAEAPTPGTGDAQSPTRESTPRYVQAGAPGEASEELTPEEMAALDVPGHSPADVRFMQGMIPHHAQAIEMVDLMPGRTTNEQLLRLGGRIEISQRDEIALMSRWLRERGEAVPGEQAMGDEAGGHAAMGHDGMDHALMPGMLTPEQMQQLADANGVEFDALFLELMIGHHEGALIMVSELFATPGGGQESFTYQFAADVDADQEMEIRRMQQMLGDLR